MSIRDSARDRRWGDPGMLGVSDNSRIGKDVSTACRFDGSSFHGLGDENR
jgi:hypothetical protein